MGLAIGDTVLDRGGNCFDGLWKACPATLAVLGKLRPDIVTLQSKKTSR